MVFGTFTIMIVINILLLGVLLFTPGLSAGMSVDDDESDGDSDSDADERKKLLSSIINKSTKHEFSSTDKHGISYTYMKCSSRKGKDKVFDSLGYTYILKEVLGKLCTKLAVYNCYMSL